MIRQIIFISAEQTNREFMKELKCIVSETLYHTNIQLCRAFGDKIQQGNEGYKYIYE